MCTFRNRVNKKQKTAWAASACLMMLACTPQASNGLPPDPAQTKPLPAASPYFPLSVGNSWRYSCSVEGEFAFTKTLNITAIEKRQEVEYYRGELQVGDDPTPLKLFYRTDKQGGIHQSLDPAPAEDTLLITSNPRPGEKIGNLLATEESVETPATGEIKALLIENFSLDDPQLHEEQRMEWEGKYYASGIGLVIEADGLGGSCVLEEYHLTTH